MPIVSAVIPCYNVAEFLTECLDGLVNQTTPPTEVICVDDRSSDDTVAILERYKRRYPELFTILLNERNGGASVSRNRGLNAAKGTYVQFLDADDLLLPEKLARQSEMAARLPEPALIVGSYLRRQTDGVMVERRMGRVPPWEGLIIGDLGVTSANLWPREAVQQVGGWNEALGSSQEYELMFRLLKSSVPVVVDDALLTVIRERESGSISKKDPSANSRRFIELRIEMLKHLRAARAGEAIENVALQRIFEVIRILYRHDAETATRFYKEHIHGRYFPRRSKFITAKYLLLYRLMGFEWAEKSLGIVRQRSAVRLAARPPA